MSILKTLTHWVDVSNDKLAWLADWAVLLSCLFSAFNAVVRKLFTGAGIPFFDDFYFKYANGWLEIQWYLFAAVVMLGASVTLRMNEHVRVDVFYGRLMNKKKVYVDIFGLLVFLLPVCITLMVMTYPHFTAKLMSGEMSSNAGGLIRWPVWLLLPFGFLMLSLQGLAELIKRIGWLKGIYSDEEINLTYERPLQ